MPNSATKHVSTNMQMHTRQWPALIRYVLLIFCASQWQQELQAAPVVHIEQAKPIISSRRHFEQLTPALAQRHRTQRADRYQYAPNADMLPDGDENADIIPELDFERKNLGQQLKQRAEQLVDEMKQTWTTMVAALRDCVSELSSLFDDDDDDSDFDFEDYDGYEDGFENAKGDQLNRKKYLMA